MLRLRLVSFGGSALIAGIVIGAAIAAPPPGFLPLAAKPPQLSTITLFEKPNFQGRSMTFEHRVASLNAVGFNDLAQSVKVSGKQDWVLCESRNFLGRCIRVHLKETDLKRQKFSVLASSIYPVVETTPR